MGTPLAYQLRWCSGRERHDHPCFPIDPLLNPPPTYPLKIFGKNETPPTAYRFFIKRTSRFFLVSSGGCAASWCRDVDAPDDPAALDAGDPIECGDDNKAPAPCCPPRGEIVDAPVNWIPIPIPIPIPMVIASPPGPIFTTKKKHFFRYIVAPFAK